MATIQIFDPPMCCSTGVCGPEVDPRLPRFSADLDWLGKLGHQVQRFNLAQQPLEFVQNPTVQKLLGTAGTNCLPLVLIDGKLVSRGTYPARAELAAWVGEQSVGTLPISTQPLSSEPDSAGGDCCGQQGCC